jgi:DegV family protein with EDD domain
MTAEGSGAYQAATVAQSMMQEKNPAVHVEVIDTRNVSLCQGWMAVEAARAALAGMRLGEIVNRVRSMIPVTHMLQTADTLKYLYMGGRIGKAKQLVGSLLNIKPIIGMEAGTIVPVGVARSRSQAYQAIADKVEETVGKAKIKVAYVHAGARQEVDKLRKVVEERVSTAETLIAELSPALAVHTGPGTAGLCFFPVESGA